jgi:hypothetical protein
LQFIYEPKTRDGHGLYEVTRGHIEASNR